MPVPLCAPCPAALPLLLAAVLLTPFLSSVGTFGEMKRLGPLPGANEKKWGAELAMLTSPLRHIVVREDGLNEHGVEVHRHIRIPAAGFLK